MRQPSTSPRWQRHPKDWKVIVSRGLLAFGVVGAALAVGAVHTVTLCVVTALLAGATFFAWWGAEPMSPRPVCTLLVITGVALIGYTVLQCVPMPMTWLTRVAAYNAEVWSRALSPLREGGPRWAPISLDPRATGVEALKGISYWLAFTASVRV